jgi:translocation and assembly module TamB
MRIQRLLLIIFLPLLLLFFTAVGGAVWLAASESGLTTVCGLLVSTSGGRLAISNLRGRLIGPLSIGELRWRSEDFSITARGVELGWTPAALVQTRLEISDLRVATLSVEMSDSTKPSGSSTLPDDLILPLAVTVQRITIRSLHWNGEAPVTELAARLASDGRWHIVEELSLRAGEVFVTGGALLDGRAPFALEAHAKARTKVHGLLAEHPLAMSLDVGGTLARMDLGARALQGVEGEARATLTPFAALPFSEVEANLHNIDPSAWLADAPHAKLDIVAHLSADEKDSSIPKGKLLVTNHTPGPLDSQNLPLASASVRALPDGDAVRLEDIVLSFPGGSSLRGDGRWADATLTLNLDARRFDAARLASNLFPTHFDGPLTLSLGAERQSARLEWRDEHIRLVADAEHARGTLTIKSLELAAGEARLSASGQLETDNRNAFAAKGTLRHFDPSLFVKMPAALINADIEAQGRLDPQPVVEGRFSLKDTRYAGLPLGGQGRVSLAWPKVYDVDISLFSGTNRLAATGSFGRPEDRLSLQIDAPRLAPLGIEGELRGRIDLAGTIQHPSLTLDLAAPRLGMPELGTLSGLTLQASLSGEHDSPLDVKLTMERFTRPGKAESAHAVKVSVSGSNRAHRLEADGAVVVSGAAPGQARQLHLAAEGGFLDDWRWLGQLRDLRFAEGDGPPRLTLRRPAPLEISPSAWSVGPLALSGTSPDWTAELRANADASRFQADAAASGMQFGQIKGHLETSMRGPWRIATDRLWQGRLRLDVADLSWLGELLGEGWQAGGKLSGVLDIAGTPEQPRLNGRLDGSGLAVSLPEQGLRLTNGELAAEFDGSLMRIIRLGFSSALTEPPRALRLALGEAAERFATPGRLDVSGELRIDGSKIIKNAAENAFLDVRLDRFGAWQLSDQWVALSGTGRVAWRTGILGISGNVGIDAGYWQLAPTSMPRLSDDVLVKRPETPEQSGTRPNLDLDLKADLGRRFLFRGAGLQTWLAGNVRLNARGRDLPRASGTIRLRDGRFDAYGQQLDIERGFLTFQGLLDDPALDVRAMRKGLTVEAGVQVGGTARRPVVRLVSNPDLPDTDKLAWLLLGHGPESMGAGDAALLVSAAGELLGNDSGGVVQQMKTTFGIDELGVRQGNISGGNGPVPSSRIVSGGANAASAPNTPDNDQILSVGKRLSANTMLAYEQSLTKAESIVKLTVNLTRNIAVIGRAGSDNALDILYTLTFGPPPRRDSRSDPGERKTPAAK